MRRGFTLIELMVVAGIMAFLGTAAVGGYNAFQRGMAERGAAGAASALLKSAQERALVDCSPTMVVYYNRLIREATAEENAIVVGEAVAIRRAGRITYVGTTALVDEFADVLGSYDVVEKADIDQRGSMRLWKFDDRQMSQADYSVVADAVMPYTPPNGYLHTYEGWACGEDNNPDAEDSQADLSTVTPRNGARSVVTRSGDMRCILYAFNVISGKGTIDVSGWKVGNGYGFEFARIQLPHNFIFGREVPTQLDTPSTMRVLYFGGGGASGSTGGIGQITSGGGGTQTVDVYFCTPDASGLPKPNVNPAGRATSEGNTKI